MVVKIYRYKLLPHKPDEFLNIQRKADSIYSKHVDYQLKHFQERADPSKWVELHIYRSNDEAHCASLLSEKEPQLQGLFSQFLECLSPNDKSIDEKIYDDRSIR